MTNHEFDRMHGVKVESGNWFLYSDGASREQSAYGLQKEPSENVLECSKQQRRYWELRLQDVSSRFRVLKANCERTVKAGRSCSEHDLQVLKALKTEAGLAQTFLNNSDEREEADDEREYERALEVWKRRQKMRAEIDAMRDLISRSKHRGTMAIYRKKSKEVAVLRVAINKLHREWSRFSGPTRHRIQNEVEQRLAKKAAKQLEKLEI